MQPSPRHRWLVSLRQGLLNALVLLGCALLSWGWMEAGERVFKSPVHEAASQLVQPLPLMAPDAQAAWHDGAAAQAASLVAVVAQATAWAPPPLLQPPAPESVEPLLPIELESDQPEHGLPPAALLASLAPPSAWLLPPHRGIECGLRQCLLRPPDLG